MFLSTEPSPKPRFSFCQHSQNHYLILFLFFPLIPTVTPTSGHANVFAAISGPFIMIGALEWVVSYSTVTMFTVGLPWTRTAVAGSNLRSGDQEIEPSGLSTGLREEGNVFVLATLKPCKHFHIEEKIHLN